MHYKQQQRGTHQKIMDLFHALAFEVLKKFFVIQPYSLFFFFFPLEEEREAINAGVGGVCLFGFFFCLILIHFA